MGIKRIVDMGFWNDNKVVEVFSPEDKYFMLYILTNPHTTQLGIYQFSKKVMAFELGYSVEAVSVLLERFETKYKIIKTSNETNEIAILNFLKHSIIKGGKPVEDCLLKEIKNVKNKNLITCVFENIKNIDNLNQTVKSVVNKYSNDNDNDNDNERSGDVSSTIRKNPVIEPKKTIQIKKHKYGEYENVLLTDEEYEKLKDKFKDEIDKKIKSLDRGIENKGYKYNSHYMTIIDWSEKNAEKQGKDGAKASYDLEEYEKGSIFD